jgi:predicted nuclease with RNAse H fold
VVGGGLFDADDADALLDWIGSASVVAIDAPDRASTGAHSEDESVPPKFRRGRCAEVALAHCGHWVPWVTPQNPEPGSWIAVGIALFEAISERSPAERLEVYPHAAFRALASGAALHKKTSTAGARERTGLLRGAGVRAPDLELWAHDSLDALVGAVVAAHRGGERAVRVACATHADGGGDGSAMWLPG